MKIGRSEVSKKVSLLSLTSWVKVTSPCGDSLNYVTRFGEEFFTECITFIKHPFIPSSVDLWANERSTLWSQLLLKCFEFKDVLSTIPNFLSRAFTTIWQTDVSVEIRKHHFNSLYSNIFLVCLSGWSGLPIIEALLSTLKDLWIMANTLWQINILKEKIWSCWKGMRRKSE